MESTTTQKTQKIETSAQLAGLFLAQAIKRIQGGDDPQAKHNLRNVGWANYYLSEKQAKWLNGLLERERRAARGKPLSLYVEVEGNTVGIFEWNEEVGSHGKVAYTLFGSYVDKLIEEKQI